MTTDSLADVIRSGNLTDLDKPLIADFKNLVVRDVTDPYVSPLFCIPYTDIPNTVGPKYIITLRDEDGKERTIGFLSQPQIERYFLNAPRPAQPEYVSRIVQGVVRHAPAESTPVKPSKPVGKWSVTRSVAGWFAWYKRNGYSVDKAHTGYLFDSYQSALNYALARKRWGTSFYAHRNDHEPVSSFKFFPRDLT